MTCTTLTTYFQSEVNPWEIGGRDLVSGFGHGFHDNAEGDQSYYHRRHIIDARSKSNFILYGLEDLFGLA